jgi:hypothetical protein
MKIRSGFVSNSSSSSFIVGVAKVKDVDKLKNYLTSKNLNDTTHDFGIVNVKELLTNERFDVKYNNGKVVVSSFINDAVIRDIKEYDTIFYVNIVGDEGDGSFSIYDDNGEFVDLNYDINMDSSYFSKKEIDLYNIFSNIDSGLDVKTASVSYGAGRNG